MATALTLIQQAAYETAFYVPTTLVGNTDPQVLQILNLFYATGRELRQARWWPQLKRSYFITLQVGRSQYQLPQDFYSALPSTHWDQSNKWEMLGPMSDRAWDYRLYGYITIENRKAFRVFGPDMNPNSDRGQFSVNPVPTGITQGTILTFEYITKSWIAPPNWAPSTSYAQNAWVNCDGNYYKKLTAGSQTSGGVPPNMIYGQGQDGGVFWTAITTSAWVGTTYYAPGDYVTNGGNLYVCTNGGQSAGAGGPSGTSSSITDGSVTWQYCAVSSWAGQTSFIFGSFILVGSQYYRCTTPGVQGNNTQITGKIQPTWTTTTVSDGTITWTSQTSTYDALVTDNDLVLFDDEIIIAGLKWRFLRAKGAEYDDIRAEYQEQVDTAMARWNAGKKISLAGNDIFNARNPNVPEGNFGGGY